MNSNNNLRFTALLPIRATRVCKRFDEHHTSTSIHLNSTKKKVPNRHKMIILIEHTYFATHSIRAVAVTCRRENALSIDRIALITHEIKQ